jgi:two-component system, cell cycle response regulator DivK
MQMATPRRSASNPAPADRCILVVEDNPLNMKLFSAMIVAQGYEVLQAADGSGALALARQRRPDLIIMDLQLPDMSGLDVVHDLKGDDDTREIPIIVTTAYASGGDEESIRASGCDGYMAKPIAVTEFIELIESFMTRPPVSPRYVA